MTDRELLELAAKAIGMDIEFLAMKTGLIVLRTNRSIGIRSQTMVMRCGWL